MICAVQSAVSPKGRFQYRRAVDLPAWGGGSVHGMKNTLSNYFSVRDDRIVSLVVIRNEPAAY
jgi:hypothetical protein